MSDSSLATVHIWTNHCTKPRNKSIKGISIHTMAGNGSVEGCGNVFKQREASSHYGIGSDGRIGQYVHECDRAWCCSHKVDHEVVTIEVASLQNYQEPYTCSDKAMASLINLCVDICKRNGIKKLIWKEGKQYCPAYTADWTVCNLVPHRYTTDKGKSCPGNYLFSKYGYIADEVNKRLNGEILTTNDKKNTQTIAKEVPEFMKDMEIFKQYMNEWIKEMYAEGEPEWSKKEGAWKKATNLGIVNGENPEGFIKRDEIIAVLDRIGMIKK